MTNLKHKACLWNDKGKVEQQLESIIFGTFHIGIARDVQ